MGLGIIRSRQTRTKERGHSGGEDVAEDAGFGVRQLCARKHEAEQRDEPLPSPMLLPNLPGGAVEVSVLEPLPDQVQ